MVRLPRWVERDASAATVLASLRSGRSGVDVFALEGLARDLHARVHLRLGQLPAQYGYFVAACGYVTIADPLRTLCGGGALFDDVVLFRPSRNVRRLNWTLLHELAHAVLRRAHPHHTHRDVWLLALALAARRSDLRAQSLAGLCRRYPHLPRAVLALRLAMDLELDAASAA